MAKGSCHGRGALVTARQLAKELGVAMRSVDRWVADGCPCEQAKPDHKKGGPRRRVFAVEKVRQWLLTRKAGLAARGQAPVPPAPPPQLSEAERERVGETGILGVYARLRQREVETWQGWDQANRQGNYAASSVLAKQHNETAREARLFEKDLPAILQSRGDSLPIDTILTEQKAIDGAIKSEFLGIPRALAQDLVNLEDPADIEERLRRAINGALGRIASGGEVSKG